MIKKFLFIALTLSFMKPAFAFDDSVYQDLAKFSQVLSIVDQQYVEKFDQDKMFEGALYGMLQSLDPHSIYMTADQFRAFNSETKGRFGGLGMEVGIKDHVLTVISPIEDSPAWEAGIREGDRILFVDGKSTKNMTLGDSVLLMRGPVGKKVTLGIWRNGVRKNITLKRAVIKVNPVKVKDLGDGTVQFRISSFQKGVSKVLRAEVEKFIKENGALKGVVLDLRNNPGGLLPEAVDVSDLFLSRGKIVSTKGRFQEDSTNKATKNQLIDVPTVVMINGGSASASEIVAAALKENGRAKTVGTKSFGKGSVQNIFPLGDGSAVKLTVAHYYTPKDHLIDGKGIEPDLEVTYEDFRKSVLDKKKKEQSAPVEGQDPKEPAQKSEEIDVEEELSYEAFQDYQIEQALDYLK